MEEVLQISKEGSEHILLMHANAYTPGCYLAMTKDLVKDHSISAPYQRPTWKGSDPKRFSKWSMLADDIITHLRDTQQGPVIGIGHSMGSVALWCAAQKEPSLFSKLILIEPVILPKKFVVSNRLTPFWFKKRFIPLIKIAANRTNRWESKEDLRSYLLSKKVFKRFDKEVLEDFIDDSFRYEDGVTLKYPRAWEARIYGTAPNLWGMMDNLPCPMTVIRAEHTDVLFEPTWHKLHDRMKQANLVELKGVGHLAPFEDPKLVSDTIKKYL